MSWLADIWRRPSEDWTFLPIPGAAGGPSVAARDVVPDEVYLKLQLHSMRIPLARQGFNKFFGVVHAFSRLNDRKTGVSEFHVVASPGKLESLDRAHMDHVVMGAKLLLGPVVYRGGLELDLGLFSVVAENLALPYLSLLQTLSETAGVAFVGAAKPIVGSIKAGMELLAKQPGQAALEVGYSGRIDAPKAGLYLLARLPRGSASTGDLKLDAEGHVVAGAAAQAPHIILSVEASAQRDDWFQIPEIRDAYQQVREALKQPNSADRAKETFDAFKVACLLSDDLVYEDAQRLVAKVDATMHQVLGTAGARRAVRGTGLVEPGQLAAPQDLKDVPLYD